MTKYILLIHIFTIMLTQSILAQPSKTSLQLKSLRELFPQKPPPSVTLSEKQNFLKAFKKLPQFEKDIFAETYPRSIKLRAYANRDTDQDGIFDYRINTYEYEGRFYEGDPDIDNDGINNILDTDPYKFNSTIVDTNHNSIPDHIDFSLKDKSAQLQKIQQNMYNKHDIILFERTAPMNDNVAIAFQDSFEKIFKSKPIKTLRSFASEDYAFLKDDDGETCAMVFAPSQSMMIYKGSLNYKPLFLFSLLIHEMTHSYQYQLDWSKDDNFEFARSFFPMTNFSKLVAPFGWQKLETNLYPWTKISGFAALEENKPSFHYYGESTESWHEWLEEIWNNTGEDYLDEAIISSKGIVGDYSLTDPLEWHADQLAAYVVTSIEDYYLEHSQNPQKQQTLKNIRQEEKRIWPAYKHRNILNSEALGYFRKNFPINTKDLAELSERYVRPFEN